MIRAEAVEPKPDGIAARDTGAGGQLRAFIERIERLQEERKTIADDIAEVFKELEGSGFDKIAAKAILKIRAADDGLAIWQERSATLDLYLGALGMLPEALPAPAPARTREIIEHFPHSSSPPKAQTTDSPIPPLTVSGTLSPDHATPTGDGHPSKPSSEAARAKNDDGTSVVIGQETSQGHSGQAEPFEPPAFLVKKPLRPHCLHPDNLELCAGSGSKHCYACLKARDEHLISAPPHGKQISTGLGRASA